MFDEHLEPPRVDRPISLTPAVLVPVNSAGTPSSTTIDQDAPSPNHSPSSSALQSPCLHHGVAPKSTLMDENPFASVDNDPFINIFAPEPTSAASSSGDAIPQPDRVMIIALKWIYKVKLDEYGDVLKNKAWLVAKGYRQEDGIDFEESFALVARIEDTMADMNILANDAPAEHSYAIAPPTRMDDQILPSSNWTKTSCAANSVGKNLVTASRGKKKTTHLPILSIRFTKLIIHHLKTKHNIHPRSGLPLHYSHDESILNTLRYVRKDGREIFGMSIPDALLTNEINGAPYYGEYQEHVAKYQQHLDAKHGKAAEGGASKSFKATKVIKPKGGLVTKIRKPMSSLKLVDEPSTEDVPVEEPAYNEEEENLQRALELSLKEQVEQTQGPARPVVIREPDSEKIQPLLEVQGKKKRHIPMPVEASGPAESPSLDTKLALTDSETESDNEVPEINTGDQDEGHARPNPGSQPQSIHVVHARPNLEPIDLEATDASPFQNPKQLDKEFTITAYPNVQENLKLPSKEQVILEDPGSSTRTLSSLHNLEKELSFTDQFFVEKQQEKEPGKTNVEAEVQSMVSVPIHQDTSLVPRMTTLVIDLKTPQSGSLLPKSSATTSTFMTTTNIPPPPPQP
nr:retrovirus-related Pol polyprotein from transposon TNT 1-94 [Tanacetum cinerariifolium]